MTGAVSLPAGRFPVFTSRPSMDFVRRWHRHIEQTGEPETFECISTDRPARGAQVRLLSSDIVVPLDKRGGERVPCPLCSPTSPKFGTGRMAWFPDERAARFIGHTCAKRYLGENYRVAERQFRIEQACQAYQDLWAGAGAKLAALDAFSSALVVPAKALQFSAAHLFEPEVKRDYLDKQAPGFAGFLFRDRMNNPGRLPFAAGPRAASGELKGLEFLSPSFAPAALVSSLRAACADLRKPLPEWAVEEGENSAAKEIIRRGRRIDAVLRALPAGRDDIALAQAFLQPANLRTLERWAGSGLSPFDTLIIRWRNSRIILRSATWAGAHYCELLVHPGWDAGVPKLHKGIEL